MSNQRIVLVLAALTIAAATFGCGKGRPEASQPSYTSPEKTAARASKMSGLMPESLHVVECSDAGVSYRNPNGNVQALSWNDLTRVEIVTNDKGPKESDVFFVLSGNGKEIAIPQGATGDKELNDRLLKLPGYRFMVAIEAMSSVENRRFLVWERTQ